MIYTKGKVEMACVTHSVFNDPVLWEEEKLKCEGISGAPGESTKYCSQVVQNCCRKSRCPIN